MPQEDYNYDGSFYHSSLEQDFDDPFSCYINGDYMLSASVPRPQPVVGLGPSMGDESEQVVELIGSASVHNGTYTLASTIITSASNKSSHLIDIKEEENNEWQEKPVKQWSTEDIVSWVVSVASEKSIPYENVMLSGFRNVNDGLRLCQLGLEDFMHLEPNHGHLFYDELQKLQASKPSWYPDHHSIYGVHGYENSLPAFNASFRSDMDNQCPDPLASWPGHQQNISNEDLKCERSCSGIDSEGESRDLKTKVKKKGVGRPPRDPKDPSNRTRARRKSGQKCGRLWEFIRDLLKDQKYCPTDICWVDHDQGMFRFVQSERVARLWGDIKKNPKMNYEKLSRAMRYYYKSKVLLPVLGRRLVYRFGPNATNWRSNNPNFLCKMTPSNQ